MMPEKSVDTDAKADTAWLLGVQRKLYQWSRGSPEGIYRELWGWVTDIRNLRCAWSASGCRRRHRGQGSIVHAHPFGGVERLGFGLSNNQRERLPDVTNLVDR